MQTQRWYLSTKECQRLLGTKEPGRKMRKKFSFRASRKEQSYGHHSFGHLASITMRKYISVAIRHYVYHILL